MITSAFRAPLALDSAGQLVHPQEAAPGDTYRCPACGDRLIFKAGQVRPWHFAHAANGNCTPESVTHQTAKRLIQQVVTAWKAGEGAKPQIFRRCAQC